MVVISRRATESRTEREGRALAWLAMLPIVVGALVLVGWAADTEVLRDGGADPPIKVNAALCMVLLGVAVRPGLAPPRVRVGLCVVVAAVAGLTMLEYATSTSFGIDELFVDDIGGSAPPSTPGRMALLTAIAFLLLAAGAVLIEARGRPLVLGQSLAIAAFAVALTTGVAHAYGVPPARTPGVSLTSTAVPTVVVLMALALAVALLRPHEGVVAPIAAPGPISLLGRKLLLTAMVVPVIVGLARVRAQRAGIVGTELGTAVFAMTNVALFATLAWLSTASLRRAEIARLSALEELAASQRQLQVFLDRAPAVIFAKDLDGRFTLANEGLEKVFGAPRGGVIGRTDADFVPAELIPGLQATEQRIITARQTIEMEEEFGVGPTGGPRRYQAIKFPLVDPDGRVYGVGGIATDITERRAMEVERDALADRVRQTERLESLGQLAGGIAHDFNNLLAVIVTYATFVERAVAGTPAADDVAAIRQAAERGAEFTRQLVGFSRHEPTPLRAVELGPLVVSVSEMMRRTLPATVELVTNVPDGLPPVASGAGEVEQVLVNLIVNARDAMPAGGRLTLDLGVDEEELDMVRLTVADTGFGMDPADQDRAFEPFFTTKPRGQGTGLGLSTVHAIVRRCGGRALIRSAPGEGTAVDVHLPVASVALDASGGLPVQQGPAASSDISRVLLVEDDDVLREGLARVLRDNGFPVTATRSAEEALPLGEGPERPDVLVTDVVLPREPGPVLARRLRAGRPLPVLFITAHATDELAEVELDEHTDLLQKPFEADALVEAVALLARGVTPP
jgi:PAS domain S-box-containing protein